MTLPMAGQGLHLLALVVILLLVCLPADTALHTGAPSAARKFLGPHNAARSALRLPPLSWDRRLAAYAQWYGRTRRGDCALRHSGGPYGENLFWGSGDGWSPAQAVAAWAAERRWYTYGANSCAGGEQCGHYTQMVWRSTRRVGCAVVACGGSRRGELMVCEYDPPGNYIGQRPY